MTATAYIGVGGKSERIKSIYIGVNGAAKKVKRGYIGVNGVAKLFYRPFNILIDAWRMNERFENEPIAIINNTLYVYKIGSELISSDAVLKKYKLLDNKTIALESSETRAGWFMVNNLKPIQYNEADLSFIEMNKTSSRLMKINKTTGIVSISNTKSTGSYDYHGGAYRKSDDSFQSIRYSSRQQSGRIYYTGRIYRNGTNTHVMSETSSLSNIKLGALSINGFSSNGLSLQNDTDDIYTFTTVPTGIGTSVLTPSNIYKLFIGYSGGRDSSYQVVGGGFARFSNTNDNLPPTFESFVPFELGRSALMIGELNGRLYFLDAPYDKVLGTDYYLRIYDSETMELIKTVPFDMTPYLDAGESNPDDIYTAPHVSATGELWFGLYSFGTSAKSTIIKIREA